jgi:SAM-dependent methyltransferase
MGETAKAHARREREGWYTRYIDAAQPGIDIGSSTEPVSPHFWKWDLIYGHGDATLMKGMPDNFFQTIYASHVLEHLHDPKTALQNWWRICRPGGLIIILVPHRDLYEKKKELPSDWNHDHKWFWLPHEDEPPVTKSFWREICEALPHKKCLSFRVLDYDYDPVGPGQHALGEFSIEAIIQKP